MGEERALAVREKDRERSGCFGLILALILPLAGLAFAGLPGLLGGGLGAGFLFAFTGGKAKWKCGECKNPIASGDVKLCPACRAEFGATSR